MDPLLQAFQEAIQRINNGDFQGAMEWCEKILQMDPNNIAGLNLLGISACQTGDLETSIASLQRSLVLDPKSSETLYYLGEAYLKAGAFAEAKDCLFKAVEFQPDLAPAWNSLGYALTLLKRPKEAIPPLQKALELEPNNPDFLNRLGLAFRSSNQLDQAIDIYRKTLTLHPKFAQAWNNLGAALQLQNKPDDAAEAYQEALSIHPNYVSAWNNLGALRQSLHQLESAIQAYRKAQEIEPKYFAAHVHEGHARLLNGDFKLGWLKHEYRWLSTGQNPNRHFTQPMWQGTELLSGKSILLHSEQGLGDTIQFLRYTKDVATLGATVHLEVQKPLVELASTVSGATSTTAFGESLPDFDFHCPLMTLPLVLQTTLETIPTCVPYIHPSDAAQEKWRDAFGRESSSKKRRVGLVWRGNPEHENDANRSLSIELISPLLSTGDFQFVSLQIDLSEAEKAVFDANPNCLHYAGEISSFDDTAALISHLDLVISADTSVAHLAGALGKPVWILLPFAPDWRWMLNRTDSPWYPTAKLYRQPKPRDWGSVIQAVRTTLLA